MKPTRCVYCGKMFRPTVPEQKYCSVRCGERYRKGIGRVCVYNEGVQCASDECQECVWNPGSGVSQNRLAAFLAGGGSL